LDKHREWPWPKRLGEKPGSDGNRCGPLIELLRIAEVHDERMISRSSLHRKQSPDGRIVGCVRTEAVDRLGRKRDKSAGTKDLGSPLALF
jgi:hypothetical protein